MNKSVFSALLVVYGFLIIELDSLILEASEGDYGVDTIIYLLPFVCGFIVILLGSGMLVGMFEQKYLKATRNYEKGQFDKSISRLKNILSQEPTNCIVLNNLGVAYTSLKQFDNALDAFNKALELNPEYKQALNGIGTVYAYLEDFDGAKEMYEKALKIPVKPGVFKILAMTSLISPLLRTLDDQILLNLARVYFKEDDLDRSMEICQKALTINSKNNNIWEKIGEIYIKKKEYDKCIETLESLNKNDRKQGKILSLLGMAYYKKKNLIKTKQYLGQALKLDAKDHLVSYHLAKVYLELKKYKIALKYCNLSLRYEPENKKALELHSQIAKDMFYL